MKKKPPIGVEPKEIWLDKRLRNIEEAIGRYIDDGFPIPEELIKERNELIARK